MEPFHIFGKTEQGVAALNAARGALSAPARQLLILIDGQRDVGELRGIFGEDTLARLLPQLEAQGYVRRLADNALGRPTVISTVSRVPDTRSAPPAFAAPAPIPARAASSLPIKALLAMVVVGSGGALWWFLGGPATTAVSPVREAPSPAAAAAATTNSSGSVSPSTEDAANPAPAPATAGLSTASFDRNAARSRDAGKSIDARPNSGSVASGSSANPAAGGATAPAAATAASPAAQLASSQGPNASTAPQGRTGSARPAPASVEVEPARSAAAPSTGAGASLASGTPVAAAPVAVPPPPPQQPSPTPAQQQPPPSPQAPPVATPVQAAPVTASPGNTAAASNAATPGVASNTGSAPNPAPAATSARVAAPPSAAGPQLHARERTMPVLSRSARRAGIDSGQLVVRLHVSPKGTVDSIDVLKANPSQIYDSTVEHTLKNWTFDPPGVPVQSTVEFDFKS